VKRDRSHHEPIKYQDFKKLFDEVRESYNRTVKELLEKEGIKYFSTNSDNGSPIVYKLEDLDGEEIKGIFYEEELSEFSTNDTTLSQVEKILRRKKNLAY